MKETVRQLFTTLAPAILCISVCVCTQMQRAATDSSAIQTVYLVPKNPAFDSDRISMLSAQKDRYSQALHDYRAILTQQAGQPNSRECVALRNTVLCASREYAFVAEETADSAFRASGLPKALPRL